MEITLGGGRVSKMAARTWCTFDTPGSQRHNTLPFLHWDLAYETRTWPNGCVEVLFVYIVPVFVFVYVNYLPLTANVKCFFNIFYITGIYTVTSAHNIYTNING